MLEPTSGLRAAALESDPKEQVDGRRTRTGTPHSYKNLPPAMARQTLRGLENAGVVDHPCAGTYTIADPMLRHHLLAVAHGTGKLPDVPTLTERWTTRSLLGSFASAPGPVSLTAEQGGAGGSIGLPPAAAEPVEEAGAAAANSVPIEAEQHEPSTPETTDVDVMAAGTTPEPPGAEAIESPAPATEVGDVSEPGPAFDKHPLGDSETALRHPDRDEAGLVEDYLVRAIESQAPKRRAARGTSKATPTPATTATAARVGRFISESVAHDPTVTGKSRSTTVG